MSANEHIDELLSGFLDGELTADEMRELQSAMAADASLGPKVEQLRQLGDELRLLPQKKLPGNFAARVLAVAQVEASKLPVIQTSSLPNGSYANAADSIYVVSAGQEATESIVAGSRTIGRNTTGRNTSWRTASISLTVAAASLLFVAYLSGWIGGPAGSGGTNPLVDQLVGHSDISGGESKNPQLVESPSGSQSESADLKLEADAGLAGGERLVGNERSKPTMGQMGFEILTVLEIQPSKEARSSNLIEAVLKQAGIDLSTPVTASGDVVEVLNATRSINPGAGKGNDDQVALVLVRAPSVIVDRAMNMIWERNQDFPFVVMDLAFDLPGKDLVRKLLDAQRPVASESQSLATPIVIAGGTSRNLEDMAQFSSPPLSHYVAADQRSKPMTAGLELGTPVTSDEEQAPTHLLLVIRKPAE